MFECYSKSVSVYETYSPNGLRYMTHVPFFTHANVIKRLSA